MACVFQCNVICYLTLKIGRVYVYTPMNGNNCVHYGTNRVDLFV